MVPLWSGFWKSMAVMELNSIPPFPSLTWTFVPLPSIPLSSAKVSDVWYEIQSWTSWNLRIQSCAFHCSSKINSRWHIESTFYLYRVTLFPYIVFLHISDVVLNASNKLLKVNTWALPAFLLFCLIAPPSPPTKIMIVGMLEVWSFWIVHTMSMGFCSRTLFFSNEVWSEHLAFSDLKPLHTLY